MSGLKELAAVIGKQGRLRTPDGLGVDVAIVDARQAYGRVDYRVAPIEGEGSAWVSSNRVEVR